MFYSNQSGKAPEVSCSGLQSTLQEAYADVLLLYDCCFSASTTTTTSIQGHCSVTEVIAACGYETIAPQVGRHSFTNALIHTLVALARGPGFSVGELHSRILTRLKCWTPELATDVGGGLIRNADGRPAFEREFRRTPVHTILCETARRRSIVLQCLEANRENTLSIARSVHVTRTTEDYRRTTEQEGMVRTFASKPLAVPSPATFVRGGDLLNVAATDEANQNRRVAQVSANTAVSAS